jgi:hypothetical protein
MLTKERYIGLIGKRLPGKRIKEEWVLGTSTLSIRLFQLSKDGE